MFNSASDYSNSIPVLIQQLNFNLTTAALFMLWHSATLFFLNYYNCLLLPVTYSTRVLLSQAVIKTSKLKTINTFVGSFILPFNITRGNRTLQPQLPFLYKWEYHLTSCYNINVNNKKKINIYISRHLWCIVPILISYIYIYIYIYIVLVIMTHHQDLKGWY